jgi:hypothetical protein
MKNAQNPRKMTEAPAYSTVAIDQLQEKPPVFRKTPVGPEKP